MSKFRSIGLFCMGVGLGFIAQQLYETSKDKIENPEKIVMEEHYKGMDVMYRGAGFTITVSKGTEFELEDGKRVWKVSGTLRFDGADNSCVWSEGLSDLVSEGDCEDVKEIRTYLDSSHGSKLVVPTSDLSRFEKINLEDRFDGLKESLEYSRVRSNWETLFR